MKKTVILSTNDHPDYFNYLPFVREAWNKLGWDTLTFYLGFQVYNIPFSEQNKVVGIWPVEGYREDTVIQCARLFSGHLTEGLIMTGDVDMIPLSDYWKPDPNKITCYGIDLTGDNQIPICYVAMSAEKWREIIPETTMEDLLSKYPQSSNPEFQKYWFTDQNILTERINKHEFISIDRGFNGNLAKGRIDRADWERTINNSDVKIDAHMVRPFDLEQTKRIMQLIK